ncbi:MAG: hypothetical protein KGR26_13165, partial [Cyanobacteria bacterium REEB65]|nr:hypothetical protein [Cyanobacteria bacterium REEB65]
RLDVEAGRLRSERMKKANRCRHRDNERLTAPHRSMSRYAAPKMSLFTNVLIHDGLLPTAGALPAAPATATRLPA